MPDSSEHLHEMVTLLRQILEQQRQDGDRRRDEQEFREHLLGELRKHTALLAKLVVLLERPS